MHISLVILFLVMFLVFIFTAEGVGDSAKKISTLLGVVVVLWLVVNIL